MLLWHGTTFNRFKQAIQQGYLGTNKTVWDCSEEETTYFWTEEFFREEHGIEIEGGDMELLEHIAVKYALESSDIALSMENENLKRVVLVFDSNDLNKIGKIEIDDSCENMEYCRKFTGKIPLSLIRKIYVDREKRDLLLLYYIGLAKMLSNRSYMTVNDYWVNIPNELLECAEKIYEQLNYWHMETFDTIGAVEETDLDEIQRNIEKTTKQA